ncbi:hypothetical protein B296_00046568 [Ensete ventricosum]|uniref:Uncharacterized protein n=1 Tax=Ensete ventricosum TaxID=4639 RepID=A0A426YFG8_ENSVE|nr:hypothetical protein B296_00046568 [Ensete ventricosum]
MVSLTVTLDKLSTFSKLVPNCIVLTPTRCLDLTLANPLIVISSPLLLSHLPCSCRRPASPLLLPHLPYSSPPASAASAAAPSPSASRHPNPATSTEPIVDAPTACSHRGPTAAALTPAILAVAASSPSAASSSVGHRSSSPPLHHCRPSLPSHYRNLLFTAAYSPRSHTPTPSPPLPCFSPSSLLLTCHRCHPSWAAACHSSPLPPLLCCCRQLLLLPHRRSVAPPLLPATAVHLFLYRCCRRPLAAAVASSRAFLIFFPLQPPQPQPPLTGPRCLPSSHFFFLAGPHCSSEPAAPPLHCKLIP